MRLYPKYALYWVNCITDTLMLCTKDTPADKIKGSVLISATSFAEALKLAHESYTKTNLHDIIYFGNTHKRG